MGKMEEALRAEILRLVQRELESQLAPLAEEVSELKRALNQVPRAQPAMRGPQVAAPPLVSRALEATEEEIAKARISPEVIRALRRRVGVSQSKLALIIGVTPGAVAQWELAMVKPRGRNLAALVALRKLGRAEVATLLAERRASPREGQV